MLMLLISSHFSFNIDQKGLLILSVWYSPVQGRDCVSHAHTSDPISHRTEASYI